MAAPFQKLIFSYKCTLLLLLRNLVCRAFFAHFTDYNHNLTFSSIRRIWLKLLQATCMLWIGPDPQKTRRVAEFHFPLLYQSQTYGKNLVKCIKKLYEIHIQISKISTKKIIAPSQNFRIFNVNYIYLVMFGISAKIYQNICQCDKKTQHDNFNMKIHTTYYLYTSYLMKNNP